MRDEGYFVVYKRPNGRTSKYNAVPCDSATAMQILCDFMRRYGNGETVVKKYPNGKGSYRFTNARIVRADAIS